MSEYQYYEFRAVDRPLTKKEQAELRALSTRADISAYHFSNVYHWGSFKGSPDDMVERYFDAHLYVANWGERRLVLRIPSRYFDLQRARPYQEGRRAAVQKKGDHVILRFELDEAWSDDIQEGAARARASGRGSGEGARGARRTGLGRLEAGGSALLHPSPHGPCGRSEAARGLERARSAQRQGGRVHPQAEPAPRAQCPKSRAPVSHGQRRPERTLNRPTARTYGFS